MVSPQKQNGFVGIANEIWDQILRRGFTKRQNDILNLIIRLSYGCGRKVALIPMGKDFALCGVRENHVKDELNELIECRIIFRGTAKGEYLFNKNYSEWTVPVVTNWDDERFRKLIHLNLVEAKKDRKEHPETGSFPRGLRQGNLPETGSSELETDEEILPETGSFEDEDSDENFPNQEVTKEAEDMSKLPEKGSSEEKNFPKREGQLPEKGSSTPDFPSSGAASRRSKKGLNKLKNKESKDLKDKTIVEIVSYLNEATGKNFSPETKETVKLISGRLSEGRTFQDFKHVIDVKTAEWLHSERMNQFLKPTTLFAQSNFESYLNQKRRDGDGQPKGCPQQSGIQPMAGASQRAGQAAGSRRRFTEEEFDSLGIGQQPVRVSDMQGSPPIQTDSGDRS